MRGHLTGRTAALSLALVGVILSSMTASAAGPATWTKQLVSRPGAVVALAPGPSGGFYVAIRPGFYSSARQGIRRFDASGERLWTWNFPSGSSVWLGDLASDATGVYLTFREWADDEETHYAVRRFALDGRVLWTARWTGWQERVDPDRQGYPPVTVSDGIVSVLYDPTYTSDDPDYYQAPRAVARFDADDGDRLADWKVPVKRYPAYNWSAEDIASTPAGVYTLTGFRDENGSTSTDQLQVDLLQAGDVVWSKRVARHSEDASARSLSADPGGTVVSYAVWAGSSERTYVLRIRPDGTTAWLRRQPVGIAGPAVGDGTTTWSVHHVYSPATSTDVVIRRLDADGATVRERRYGDSHWESVDWAIAMGRFLYVGGVIRRQTSTSHYPMVMKIRKP